MKKRISTFLSVLTGFICCLLFWNNANAQSIENSYPVTLKKDTLFYLHASMGPFSADERSRIVEARIAALAQMGDFTGDSLIVKDFDKVSELIYKGKIIITVAKADAEAMGKTTSETAVYFREQIVNSIEYDLGWKRIWRLVKEVGLTLLVILLLYFLISNINKVFRYVLGKVILNKDRLIKGVRFKSYEFMSPEQELMLIRRMFNVVKWLLVILIVYAALPVLFSIFPATKGIAQTLFGYIWRPFRSFLGAIWSYFPNVISIAIVLFITHYIVKFLKFLSTEIQTGKLQLPGFYPDWSLPTFNIVRFLLYAFALVVIFPYLPGSNSPIFQGVSVFLGLLISLGSSSAISNLIAGLVITYMRAFRIGDRVKIGDTTGDVLEKTALVTRLRTIKNETITIPNSSILTGHTINYSASAGEFSLILHTTVTIGYDVPWRKVHDLLKQAALKTNFISHDPAPFVHQTSLDDFYVSYELNAYTEQPKLAAAIYSLLHQNIQDIFFENGVEIMSPHYRAERDGNAPAVPPRGVD